MGIGSGGDRKEWGVGSVTVGDLSRRASRESLLALLRPEREHQVHRKRRPDKANDISEQ